MELTVAERLLVMNLLPKEGDLTTIKLVRKAREELSFSDEEHTALNFRQKGDQIVWDDPNVAKDCKIGDLMTEKVKDELKRLDKEQKIREEHLTVYEKFVG